MVKKAFLSMKNAYDKAMVMLLLGMTSNASWASGGIGNLFENTLSNQASSVAKGFQVIFYAAGFIVLGFGVYKFISNNPQETTGQKIKWVVIGAMLLALGWVIQILTGTVGTQAGKASLSF